MTAATIVAPRMPMFLFPIRLIISIISTHGVLFFTFFGGFDPPGSVDT